MQVDKNSIDPHFLLSPTIKLLGDILGEVIIEQTDEECFNLEEKIRLLSKSFREKNDLDSAIELKQVISKLSPKQRTIIIRSFSLFFQLINLAEEDFRIRVDNIKEKADHDSRNDTIRYAIRYAKNMGLELNELLDLFKEIQFQLVYTAHPTEARRLTNLLKLKEIFSLIQILDNLDKESMEWIFTRSKIKEHISLLWQSDDLREDKVEILDEVRTNLFYFENTVFDVLPKLIEILKFEIINEYKCDKSFKIPNFLNFGTWVGGDRDGHPYVTSNITIQTLLLQKRLCIRKYLKSINTLLRELSSSLNLIGITDELQQSIDSDIKKLPDFANQTKGLNQKEPYRRKLDFIRVKLENTLEHVEKSAENVGLGHTLVGYKEMNSITKDTKDYYARSNDLISELKIIDRSLRKNKGIIIAEGKLSTLITQVNIFGFHLAPLDLRQDSEVHLLTIEDIFQCIGLKPISKLNFIQRRELMINELQNPRPLGIKSFQNKLSEMSTEVISTLEIAKKSLDIISPRSIGTYIISMSRDESDILILMLLMKEVGLIEITESIVKYAAIDIAPLFETKKDLENAPAIIDRLFSNPMYRSLLSLRDDIQEIMIGYSDSTKDVGVLESNYRLLTAQQQLVQVADKFGVKLRIFHGRGGSISRGGGPTNRSILSQPLGALMKQKITEQGEVIGSNYSNPSIAYRHLEQIISAMVIRAVRDKKLEPENNPANPPEIYLSYFQEIGNHARIKYEELIKQNSNFIPFYLEFTPLDLIERATIGSRPSRRSVGVKDIGGLRAIPWIFSWMQTRLLLPGFYGVGTAMKNFEEKYGIEKLRELYQNWPYFESLIDNLQMVGLKADMNIAYQYLPLVRDKNIGNTIFDLIKSEYELARNMILKTTGFDELLDNTPNIQKSIKRRNPYIDPLNLIQIQLLKLWREKGRPNDLSPSGLQRSLLQTVNGIAAGLRNTG